MRVVFIDLIHTTKGRQINTVPLGIGLLATYLKKHFPVDLDIKLLREPEEAQELFKSADWVPDIVAVTQYCWNSQLNLHFARLAKNNNPGCLVVAGGPNLELSPKARTVYLKENNFVDLCVAYDGEIPLLEIVKRYQNGESIATLRRNPPVGVYAVDQDTQVYMASIGLSPRLTSIDEFGAVYASGIFDKFLDAGFYPIIEATRGCPYHCAYCHASDPYNSRILFLSPEIFKQEMDYLGRRLSDRSDSVLYFSNSNVGLYNEDMEMARIIRDTQKKHSWPKYLNCSTGKDPRKLLEMLSIVDFEPAIALQTLTPQVLKNIGRINVPLEDYVKFQNKVLEQRGGVSSTELILSLPGETKETFLKTLSQVINSGVQVICVYTLMKLAGTPLATEENAKKFQYVTRHRIVPRQFSLIDGEIILDTEEVVVGTKDMPFDDYLDLRGLCFVINGVFSSFELNPLKKLLLEFGVDLFVWVLNIQKHLGDYPDLRVLYDDFMKETRDELFISREELVKFYEDENNFNALLAGEKGDNLLRKYKHKLLSENFSSCLSLAAEEAGKLLNIENQPTPRMMLADVKNFISTRDLRSFFGKDGEKIQKNVNLNYDVPAWMKNPENVTHPLSDYAGSVEYLVHFVEEQIVLFDKLNTTYKDPVLSWQMAYRDGYTKDLWPIWTPR